MLWLHSLKVAQLLRSAACLHTNQSRSYLNHLVKEQEVRKYTQVALSLSYPYLSSSFYCSSLLKRFKVCNARLLCLGRQLFDFSSFRTENTFSITNTKYVNVRRFHACYFCTILTKREWHRQVLEKKSQCKISRKFARWEPNCSTRPDRHNEVDSCVSHFCCEYPQNDLNATVMPLYVWENRRVSCVIIIIIIIVFSNSASAGITAQISAIQSAQV